MEDDNLYDRNQKRKHISSGDTPHKPETKKAQTPKSKTPSRKALPFSSYQSRKTQSPSQKAARRIVKKAIYSPKQLSYSPKKRRSTNPWVPKERKALIQFLALYSDEIPEGRIWPTFGSSHPYWEKAAKYVQDTARTKVTRSGTAVRQEVFRNLTKKYKTLEEAESDCGLDIDEYLKDDAVDYEDANKDQQGKFAVSPSIKSMLTFMTQAQIGEIVVDGLHLLDHRHLKDIALSMIGQLGKDQAALNDVLMDMFGQLSVDQSESILNCLFAKLASQKGIHCNIGNFASISIKAMKRLQEKNKNNLVYKYSEAIAVDRPDGSGPLMPLDRMPFGLLEYCIEFYTCTNTMQISEPSDYKLWHETLAAEFPGRFQRLFAGPMWSGLDKSDFRDPLKARTNVPCISRSTQSRRDAKSPFDSTTNVQIAALDQLKSANPEGRFWIKVDGTDVKTALMESMKNVWNGDEDLGDGQLQARRAEYESRIQHLDSLTKFADCREMSVNVANFVDLLDKDITFLSEGFTCSVKVYRKKYNTPNTPEQTLKNSNWEVVEFQSLLEEAQVIKSLYEDCLALLNPLTCDEQQRLICRAVIKDGNERVGQYLRNLYKKKRIAADHIEVVMVSDERRSKKPYALPVKFVPCRTLRDQYIRDLTKEVKEKMTQRGLAVVGTTTDGEFCSLRTRGETRALHLWQLIHDARQSVQKMSTKTLLEMLLVICFRPDGSPVVRRPNPAITDDLIMEIHNLLQIPMNQEDAVTNVRGRLVPAGYQPYPYRRNTPENFRDKLQSIVSTYIFRHTITEMKPQGADFSLYLYNPEVDPVTGIVRHDRGDHNHVLKRIATSTRAGKCESLNYEAFDDALKDPKSGLTHAALIGKRKQNLKDAERLLSYSVVESLQRHGHHAEAEYVKIVANWHEATDGRGLSQLQRCRFNYNMLNYILDVWMPWHRECYDFSTIDLNRPVENIRGFSRETIIEVTSNIESQEMRRRENVLIGYPEHPRASGTDDLETFFGIVHRNIGTVFTLKEFTEYWPKAVREFTKRMDTALPFYYYTLNERYREQESSFDDRPDFDEDSVNLRNHPLRLHRLRLNQREDSSIFVSARAVLPPRHGKTIRQSFHKPSDYLPNPGE